MSCLVVACSTFGQCQEDSLLVGSTCYSSRLYLFTGAIPRCFKDICVIAHIDRNSLPAICFSLTNDPNGYQSRVNRHLLSLAAF